MIVNMQFILMVQMEESGFFTTCDLPDDMNRIVKKLNRDLILGMFRKPRKKIT